LVDSVEYNEWFIMAQKDLRSAKILFEHDADNEIVCFHCQQAIEKYLKGYLIFLTGELQEGHSLVKLAKKAMVYHEDFSGIIKDLAFVNTFYIETRYPAIDPLVVSKDDTEQCLKIMEKVISIIDELTNAKT